ncbi:MAG: hypothetical protein WBF34_25910 [Streptosporangiaceae bacterium]
MTRRQVASLFGVTSAAVATWARRGRLPVDDAATIVLVIACIVVPGQVAVFWLGWRSGRRVGHRGEVCITRRISPAVRTAAGRHRGGPDHPDWPCLPRH